MMSQLLFQTAVKQHNRTLHGLTLNIQIITLHDLQTRTELAHCLGNPVWMIFLATMTSVMQFGFAPSNM
jgi:hypothetical protein